MGVILARIQTVEEIYGLLWTAAAKKQPIEASYQGRLRLFCPHRPGRNRAGQFRVLCYQYGGESRSGLQPEGSPSNWRCIELEKLSRVKLLEDPWRTAESFTFCLMRGRSRHRRGRSSRTRPTKGTVSELSKQMSGKNHL